MSASDKDFRPKARRPRGFQDRRGASLARERALVAKISKVYEDWGFEALETGAFEYADALGKFLPDQDRPNEGVFALEDDDDQWMALRYDLTAPLARFVAEHYDGLPKPYRRWAAGPVWRNEKPGPGRFREFWQCDADTVGSASPAADAEMIAMACAAYEAAGIPRTNFRIKISSRGILDGALEAAALVGEEHQAKRLTVLRTLDKIDRLGWRGVELLLGHGRKDDSGDFTEGARLSAEQIQIFERFIVNTQNLRFHSSGLNTATEMERRGELPPIRNFTGEVAMPDQEMTIRAWGEVVGSTEAGKRGLDELNEILALLRGPFDVGPGRAYLDGSVVRGLEYYTGTVFEAELLGRDALRNPVQLGSIGGGGRYDDLVARFTGQKIPATGFSIGVSRLAAALEAGEANAQPTDGPIAILPFDKDGMSECFAFAARLRKENLKAEVYLGGAGPKAQLKYADRRNAPVAVILGGDERAQGQVTLKDLKLGAARAKSVADNKEWREGGAAQIAVPQDDLESAVARILASQRNA